VTFKVLSIEGLNNHQTRQVFVGDIMVVYSTYLDKGKKGRSIMCDDMTNKEAMMTVTLTVPQQQYMTVVIAIGLFHSTKQALWKKFPLFVQNIVLSWTQLSTSLHGALIFTLSERLGKLSHWRENLARNMFSIYRMETRTGTRQWYHFSYLVFSFTFACACISNNLYKYCIVPCCRYNCSIRIQICFRQWNNNCIKGIFHLCCSKI
jgi:hypothetical protein